MIIALNDHTSNITGDAGGIDLNKFREKISFFKGKVDPYVSRGVIITHAVVDEPHDCSDWKDTCPKASEVDQASAISEEYWPNLPTVVNTIPLYLSREGYKWVHTDIIMFQYAYHKGSLNDFVKGATDHLKKGTFKDLAWALQVKSGGCDQFKECAMTTAQFKEVGEAMCSASEGEWIMFVNYDTALLSGGMLQAIDNLKGFCSS